MTDTDRWRALVAAALDAAENPHRMAVDLWTRALPGVKGRPVPLTERHSRQDLRVGSALYFLAQAYGEAKTPRRHALAPALKALALDVGRILDDEEPPAVANVLPLPLQGDADARDVAAGFPRRDWRDRKDTGTD